MEPLGALAGLGISSGFALGYPIALGLAAGGRRGKPRRSMSLVSFEVLLVSTKVHEKQANLQDDKAIRLRVNPPDSPEHIAQAEADKSSHPPSRSLRTNHPRSQHGYQHGGPLNPVWIDHDVHLGFSVTTCRAHDNV